MEKGGKGDFRSEVHSPRLAGVTTKTCQARGSAVQRCQADTQPVPSALLKVAPIQGALCWALGDMDKSGAVCSRCSLGSQTSKKLISHHVRVSVRWRAKRGQGKLPEEVASALGPGGRGCR